MQPTATPLLEWYDANRRRLPWRALPGETPDPYRVWLSEVMLQQTTVKTVIPYFERFTATWPTVNDLAQAGNDEVMKAWAGLGYYSRARNLHRCAQVVAQQHGGRFPQAEAELRTLPGVGAYTAAAIAAIAFNEPAAVVDGNVERVITRLYAIETVLPAARPDIAARVAELTPADRPGDFAQGMMDLGATICTPRKPACGLCPFMMACRARREGDPLSFPRKAPKRKREVRRGVGYWIERRDGYVLVRVRPPRGLLGGMTEIPNSEWKTDFTDADGEAQAPVRARWRRLPGEVRHVFTHFELAAEVWATDALASLRAPEGHRWVRLADLDGEALPTVIRKQVIHARAGGKA